MSGTDLFPLVAMKTGRHHGLPAVPGTCRSTDQLKFVLAIGAGSFADLRRSCLRGPKGGSHDKIRTDRHSRSSFFRDRGTAGDGATSCPARGAPTGLSRREPLLRDKRSRKSSQQILRLPFMEQMALARRLGQFARQRLPAQSGLHTERVRLQSTGAAFIWRTPVTAGHFR